MPENIWQDAWRNAPLSPEDALALDAMDARSKRGAKLFKDKNSAKSHAKLWVLFMVMSIIFFISLRVSASDN